MAEVVDYEAQSEFSLNVEVTKGEWSAEIILTVLVTDEIELSTGVSKLDISIFPNPVEDKLIIENNTGKELQVHVFNLSGNLQLDFKVATDQHIYRVDQLRAGVYILQVRSDEISYQTKFIKR